MFSVDRLEPELYFYVEQVVLEAKLSRPSFTQKVCTLEETSTWNLSSEEFTQRDWSQGLVPRTVHTKRFEERRRRDLSPKFKPVLIRGSRRRNQVLVLVTRFCGNNGQFTR